MAFMAVSFAACDDDDNDIIISEQQLPTAAKTFLSDYYPSVKTLKVMKDDYDYEVKLSNGHTVDFDLTGAWEDVDAPKGQSIPTGFILPEITAYINGNFSGAGINEISRENYGYDVELVDGRDLRFSTTGAFLGYDR